MNSFCLAIFLQFLDLVPFWYDHEMHILNAYYRNIVVNSADCLSQHYRGSPFHKKLKPAFVKINNQCGQSTHKESCTTKQVQYFCNALLQAHNFHANKAQFSNQHESDIVREFFSIIVDNPIGKKLTPTVNASSLTNLKVLFGDDFEGQENKYGDLFQAYLKKTSQTVDQEVKNLKEAAVISKISVKTDNDKSPFVILSYGTQQYRVTSNTTENEHSILRVVHNKFIEAGYPESHVHINPGIGNEILAPDKLVLEYDKTSQQLYRVYDPSIGQHPWLETGFSVYGTPQNQNNTITHLKAFFVANNRLPEDIVMLGYSRGGYLNLTLLEKILTLYTVQSPPKIHVFNIEPVAGPVENWAWKPISTVDGDFDIETVLAVDDTRYYPERYRYSDYFLARGSHNDVKMSNRASGSLVANRFFEWLKKRDFNDKNVNSVISQLQPQISLSPENIKLIKTFEMSGPTPSLTETPRAKGLRIENEYIKGTLKEILPTKHIKKIHLRRSLFREDYKSYFYQVKSYEDLIEADWEVTPFDMDNFRQLSYSIASIVNFKFQSNSEFQRDGESPISQEAEAAEKNAIEEVQKIIGFLDDNELTLDQLREGFSTYLKIDENKKSPAYLAFKANIDSLLKKQRTNEAGNSLNSTDLEITMIYHLMELLGTANIIEIDSTMISRNKNEFENKIELRHKKYLNQFGEQRIKLLREAMNSPLQSVKSRNLVRKK